jgi:hypothetical protein
MMLRGYCRIQIPGVELYAPLSAVRLILGTAESSYSSFVAWGDGSVCPNLRML